MTLLLGLSAVVVAAAPPQAELHYELKAGAQACERQRLEDEVASRLGYAPFADGASSIVSVEISGQRKLTARLRVAHGGQPASEKALSGPADCIALTEALALALAVAIDPLVLSRPPAQPEVKVESTPAQAPESVSIAPKDPPPLPPAPLESTRLSAHVLGGLDLGTVPNSWASASLGVRVTWGALGFELDPYFVVPGRKALDPRGEVSSWALGGKAAVCWLWKALAACGAVNGGQIHFAADGLVNAQSGWVGFLSAGPRLSVLLPPRAERVAFRLNGELWVPLARATMQVSQDVVWQQAVVGVVQLGIEWYLF